MRRGLGGLKLAGDRSIRRSNALLLVSIVLMVILFVIVIVSRMR